MFRSLRAAASVEPRAVRCLDLSQSTELTCANIMCEHVGEKCACRLALWFTNHRLHALEELSLRYNDLRFLPAPVLELPRLRVLDVAYNKLETVPDLTSLSRLERLGLEGNAEMEFPEALFGHPTLRSMTVSLCHGAHFRDEWRYERHDEDVGLWRRR